MKLKDNRLNINKQRNSFLTFLLIISFVIQGGLIIFLIPGLINHMAMPHVILISLDTLKRDHLGIYGYPKDISPHIDEFSKKACIFFKAYSQSTWTKPSHASMLTGHYSLTHKLMSSKKKKKFAVLPENIKTMAEILKSQGYKTIGVTDGGYVHGKFGFSRGFQVYRDKERCGTKRSVEYLKKNMRPGKKPYFIFLHTYDIHGPYGGRDIPPYTNFKYHGPFKGHIGDGEAFYKLYTKVLMGKMDLKKEDTDYLTENYDHCIRFVDQQIGIFFNFLKKQNMWENSLIIITSDHGERLEPVPAKGFPLSRFKYYIGHIGFSDLLVKVPLIIKLPFQNKQYQYNRTVSAGIDLLPTVLQVLKLDIALDLPGISVFSNQSRYVFFTKLNAGLGLIKDEKSIIFKRQNLKQLPTVEKGPYLFDIDGYKVEENGIKKKTGEREIKKILKRINNINAAYLRNKDVKEQKANKKLMNQLKALGYL